MDKLPTEDEKSQFGANMKRTEHIMGTQILQTGDTGSQAGRTLMPLKMLRMSRIPFFNTKAVNLYTRNMITGIWGIYRVYGHKKKI